MAEALLLLLESTAEPIIPYNLHNVCLGASSNYLQCKQASRLHVLIMQQAISEMSKSFVFVTVVATKRLEGF